jgi:hypothetical protein
MFIDCGEHAPENDYRDDERYHANKRAEEGQCRADYKYQNDDAGECFHTADNKRKKTQNVNK